MLDNHNARILALQSLYSEAYKDLSGSNPQLFQYSELSDINNFTEANKELFQKIVKGVIEHNEEIEQKVKNLAPERPIKDIYIVDLIIIKIAIWEGFIGKITPPKVVINEGIELSKRYGGENSSKFVSGVLGKLYENFLTEHNDKSSK